MSMRSSLGFVAVTLLAQGAFAGKPTLHPNGTPYRVSSKPATGRSGSASITARALLGKSGGTELEVTTGVLDSTLAPPGNLAKVQVKALVPNTQRLSFTDNHNGLSGGGYVK